MPFHRRAELFIGTFEDLADLEAKDIFAPANLEVDWLRNLNEPPVLAEKFRG